jgi:hypothetical protein
MTTSAASRGSARKWDDETDRMRLRARLMRETGCSEAEVGFAVGMALERFRAARIREFVTLLVERDARRRLRVLRLNPVTSLEPEARRRARGDHAALVQAVDDGRLPAESDS